MQEDFYTNYNQGGYKMSRKITGLVGIMMLLYMGFSSITWADYYFDGFHYTKEDWGGYYTATITGYDGDEGDITIPDILDGATVTVIGEGAFEGNENLTSVAIAETVTTIKSQAFMGCSNMTGVTIPDGVKEIGSQAFMDCTNLNNVTLPDTVTTIGEEAFRGCESFTSITIPKNVTTIEVPLFPFCSNLSSINVNTSNASFSSDNGVLFNKDKTELIAYPPGKEGDYSSIPVSVTTIGNSAFTTCTKLTAITLPDTVTTIGESAFYACTGLTSIDIPENVATIGDLAFFVCSSLTAIGVQANNANFYNDASGVLFNKDRTELIAYPAGKTPGGYTIPDTVTTIRLGAFAACKITTVTIPESVTTIGRMAFLSCKNLTNVDISARVTEIPYEMFSGCTSLTGISIPDSVTTIDSEAFYQCTSLTNVTIPDSVTEIRFSAFNGCTGLTSVTIPDSVTTIGTYTFKGCTGLTSITFPASVTTIETEAFANCTSLHTANFLGDAPTTFGLSVFNDCANDFKITYLSGKTGFSTPTWKGYPAMMLSIVTFKTDGTAGATLVGDTTQHINHGDSTTSVEAVAPAGYHLTGWTASNGATYSDNPLTISNVTANLTVTANFAQDGHTVTFKTDGTAGASLNGSTTQQVANGADTTPVEAVAPAGYHLTGWTASNGTTYSDNPLTISNVTANLTVTANFAKKTYTVTFKTDGTAGASLNGSTTQQVTHGENTTPVKAVAPTGYHFTHWSASNGTTFTANPLTISNVTANLTITAKFAQNGVYTVIFKTDSTPGGSLQGNTRQRVAYGNSTTPVKAIAPEGYYLKGWKASNGNIYRDNPLKINNITTNLTVTADFAKNGKSSHSSIILQLLLSDKE